MLERIRLPRATLAPGSRIERSIRTSRSISAQASITDDSARRPLPMNTADPNAPVAEEPAAMK